MILETAMALLNEISKISYRGLHSNNDMASIYAKAGEAKSCLLWTTGKKEAISPLRFVALPTENKSSLDTRYRLDHLIDGISRIYKLDSVCAAAGEPELPFEINIPITWPNSNYNDVIRLQFKTAEVRDNSYEWIVRLLNGAWEPLITKQENPQNYDKQIREKSVKSWMES